MGNIEDPEDAAKSVWETRTDFADIAREELAGLRPNSDHSQQRISDALLEEKLFGLALSGGGIRSSTFSLGVLQRLAQDGLIRRLDYLSTVSGGGYLGSWLSAWIQREGLVDRVEAALIPPPQDKAQDNEALEITWLRKYGKYLAPQTSLFSADAWLIYTLWARNTVLNFGVLLMFLSSALLIPWVILEISNFTKGKDNNGFYRLHFFLLFVATMLALWGGSNKVAGLLERIGLGKRFTRFRKFCITASQVRPPSLVGFGSAFFLCFSSLMLAITQRTADSRGGFMLVYAGLSILCMACMVDWQPKRRLAIVGRMLIALAINAAIVSEAVTLFERAFPLNTWYRSLVLPGAISSGLCLVLTVAIGMGGRHVPDERREWWSRVAAWMCIIGVVWFMLAGLALVGPSIFDFIRQSAAFEIASGGIWAAATGVGIWLGRSPSSSGKGKDNSSSIKETVLPLLPLVFVLGLLILLSAGLSHIVLTRAPILPEATVFCDACKRETVNVSYGDMWSRPRASFVGDVEKAFPKLAMGGLPDAAPVADAIWTPAGFTDWARGVQAGMMDAPAKTWNGIRRVFDGEEIRVWFRGVWIWTQATPPIVMLVLCLMIYGLLSRLIDINEFSMHRFYRNRLARGFQGASNRRRRGDAFTNLDCDDDIPITNLQKTAHTRMTPGGKLESVPAYTGPLHLVNTAINLNLADTGLEERRASSFVFTPYACGYGVGPTGKEKECEYFQRYPKNSDLRLGTPVTASGAAASPNMGYHTSGAVAFLLTVFNVRLGYWMFNTKPPKRSLSGSLLGGRCPEEPPRKWPAWLQRKLVNTVAWQPIGPSIGTSYFIAELFAMASGDRKYVYLSDGGHFENLAVYELLRRRCRFIICIDGEQDEDMKFEGLAGLIRRARADLGCEIRIDTSDIEQRSKNEGWSKSHCAVGTLHYKEKPGLVREDENSDERSGVPKGDGYLLYIKLSVTGDEPVDIINYRKANSAFPHQSTGDQFFNESQFETYRRLGWHSADQAMRSVDPQLFDAGLKQDGLRLMFEDLYDSWYGVPRKISENFTKHTDTLNELLDELRAIPALSCLHPQFHPDWQGSAIFSIPIEDQFTACFYFCEKVILFMETVYFDLELESNHIHPSCTGWMGRFRSWAKSPTLLDTYARTKHTFSKQFCSFFDRELAGGNRTMLTRER